ncbi:MAG TPA: hypothetical protein VGC29_01165 [Flavisolibacter sp.]
MHLNLLITVLLSPLLLLAQDEVSTFRMMGDVRITIDRETGKNKNNILVIYALPNGNSTEQTMGKKLQTGDDWHFDIQHIKAQTDFIRDRSKQNITVAYLENDFKSWPLWKQKHADNNQLIKKIIDTLQTICDAGMVYLNGHSGGGSFIFGYLQGIQKIPSFIRRISFLDSNYGYDSTYYAKIRSWLKKNPTARLNVFAYNDSIALYNGKPVVSAQGGTWYRSNLMLQHFRKDFKLVNIKNDSLVCFEDKKKRIGFYFKTNPERKILHTRQVELNGFIHSILFGTKWENDGYTYFGQRAYTHYIP